MPEAHLAEEIARFDPGPPHAAARTPPASWYTLPEFHRLESRIVFRANWQPAARLAQLRQPGDFVAVECGDWPLVVLRDEKGELRAFENVCRHHAALVAQGEGCARELVCPYHAWSYGLDGRLIRAPRMGAIEGFDRRQFSLPSVAVEGFGPWAWVRAAEATAQPPSESLAALHGLLAETGYERLRFAARRTYELQCNWKVYVDNYLDGGYHVAHLHKGLASALDLEGYRTEVFERYSIQSARGAADPDPRVGQSACYAWVYPNFMINRYGPVMDTNWVLPLAANRCLTVFDFYFDAACDERFIAESLKASDEVQAEDVGICESVQRGLESGSYAQGRYAADLEHGEHHFHSLLASDLRAAVGI